MKHGHHQIQLKVSHVRAFTLQSAQKYNKFVWTFSTSAVHIGAQNLHVFNSVGTNGDKVRE